MRTIITILETGLIQAGIFYRLGDAHAICHRQGNVIDVYQAATQMTDESGQSYPYTIDTLLDRALGPEGYYGAFVANMHTDSPIHPESDAILSSALTRGVPVISARQLLTWLDARMLPPLSISTGITVRRPSQSTQTQRQEVFRR